MTLTEKLRAHIVSGPLMDEAADRIEELEADLKAAEEWLADLFRDGTITTQSPSEQHQSFTSVPSISPASSDI